MTIIDHHKEDLNRLCKTYKVDKMYLFGSALNQNFTPKSDVDLLVKFKEFDLTDYFNNYINFKEDLKMLFGREVDLLEQQALKNPILINSINKSKQLIYG